MHKKSNKTYHTSFCKTLNLYFHIYPIKKAFDLRKLFSSVYAKKCPAMNHASASITIEHMNAAAKGFAPFFIITLKFTFIPSAAIAIPKSM